MFELIRAFGLYNTLPGLILANLMLTLPFTIWVLTTFMRELPKEIEEAAFVDGATPWIVVRRVFLPLMAPAAGDHGASRLHRLVERVSVRADLHAHQRAAHRAAGHRADERLDGLRIALGHDHGRLPSSSPFRSSSWCSSFQRKIVAGLTAGAVKG